MATICAKCAKPCPRIWRERIGTKQLCPDCYYEGYRLKEIKQGKRTVILVELQERG